MTPPLDFDSLKLPILVFSGALSLVHANPAARRIFGPAGPDDSDQQLPASWFFRERWHSNQSGRKGKGLAHVDEEEDSRMSDGEDEQDGDGIDGALERDMTEDEDEDPQGELRDELVVFAKESQLLNWGETSKLVYWTGPETARTEHRAEATVQRLTSASASTSSLADHEESFIITLIRPITTTPSSLRPLLSSATSFTSSTGETVPPAASNPAADKGLKAVLSSYVHRGLPKKETIVDELPQIIFTTDKDGNVEYLNQTWFQYTGITRDGSFDVSRWIEYFHPTDVPSALASFGHSLATGEPINMEYRVLGADSNWRWFVARGIALRNPEGAITGWVAALTDVEDLVRARSEAVTVRTHVRAVLAGADVALFSVNLNNDVTFFEGSRPPFESPPLPPESTSIGSSLDAIWPEPKLHRAVQQILTEGLVGESLALMAEFRLPGNVRKWYRYRLVPLRGPSPTGVAGVIIVAANVTDRVAADELVEASKRERAALVASEAASREASRLKSEFASNLSHEIRTPLASIMGICELLLLQCLEKEHRVLVEQCLRCGEILLDLVGSILDFSKIETGLLKLESSPLKIADLLKDANLFSFNAKKRGLTFEQVIVNPLYEGDLLGDRLRFSQVLSNALSNAIKFTSTGGVVFRVEQAAESPTQVLLTFIIEDSGCGIPPNVLPTLFQPFKQADASTARQYGGSGLGLVIAKNLVKLFEGTITLESTVGVGSTVTIHVPMMKAAPVHSSSYVVPKHAANSPRRPETVHILVADDNELILSVITRTLRKLKFKVVSVSDGEAAVAAAEAQPFDLLILDCHMPKTDGYEATRRIRQSANVALRKVKIIALTASALKGDRELCLSAGFDQYLAKPVRTQALEAAIWEALDDRPL